MGTQAALFEIPKLANGFRDPAFSKNKELPLHRWVPWIAGFSAPFVDDALSRYLEGGATCWILDPFAGVGTALVQAQLHGHKVLGFEINPYAAFASKVKLEAFHTSLGEFDRHILGFERFMRCRCPDGGEVEGRPRSGPPSGFSGRTQLFSQKVESRVLFTMDFFSRIESQTIRDLFRLALGSIMVSVSNYSYEPSLTRRSAVDKPEITDAPVAAILTAKLRLMRDDIGWLQRQVHKTDPASGNAVMQMSFFSAKESLRKSQFVDLIVTSPPYLNNYHYPRNTRPQLHWLGFASGQGYKGAREDESFGKFWQTVRGQDPIPLDFKMPSLKQVMEDVRSRNVEKGLYGGPGWANYVASYFNDAHRFCSLAADLLRPGAVAVIVLGNSIIQGVEVKTDYFFGKIAELCRLSFEDTLLLRNKRTGTSIIQSSVRTDRAPAKALLYESAIVLRRR